MRIQATTIDPATLHRILAPFLPTPLPSTAPEVMWVVDSGSPPWVAVSSTVAAEV